MQQPDVADGAAETVEVPGLTPGAAAKAVLSAAASAPGYRVERADDGYLLSHRVRPAWATVTGWATAPLLVGIGILLVRTTRTGRVTVGTTGGMTVLHLRGTFRDALLRGLRALSDGSPAPVRAPLPPQILQPLAAPQVPHAPGSPPPQPFGPPPAGFHPPQQVRPPMPDGGAPPPSPPWRPPTGAVVHGGNTPWQPLKPDGTGPGDRDPRPDERQPPPATDVWATSPPIEATVRRNPTQPFSRPPGAGPHVVRLDTGERFEVGALDLIGRDPAAVAEETVSRLVKVADEHRSVSKTHLAVGADAAGVWVSDRHSTNGSLVQHANGQVTRCLPGERVYLGPGDVVRFGDRRLQLDHP